MRFGVRFGMEYDYDDFDPNGQKIKLFTPGPVYVPDWALAELSKPNDTHRSRPYKVLHTQVKQKLQKLLNTKNDVLIWTCSGSGVMEACVKNLIGPEDKGLFLSCGAFGDRWASMAKDNGKNFVKKKVELGEGFTADMVEKYLEEESYTAVFIQMNETSTGVMNPLWEIAPVVKKHGALLCVDAVSCMAGVEIKVDEWGIDVCLASTQKCFGLPAGLAVSSISEDAYKKAETVPNRGFYLDFLTMRKNSMKNQTPSTPAIPLIRALNTVLDRIFEEGVENRYKRHQQMAEMVRKWAKEHGFELFAKNGFESVTVTTIKNTKGISIKDWVNATIKRGYRFVNGYRDLAEKTFRIAAMGWITPKMVEEFLKVIEETMPK
ncbi:MAG: pyridoxal-phosphate-dependent aminotransferase family protein [Promethearchaeota archaeon]